MYSPICIASPSLPPSSLLAIWLSGNHNQKWVPALRMRACKGTTGTTRVEPAWASHIHLGLAMHSGVRMRCTRWYSVLLTPRLTAPVLAPYSPCTPPVLGAAHPEYEAGTFSYSLSIS